MFSAGCTVGNRRSTLAPRTAELTSSAILIAANHNPAIAKAGAGLRGLRPPVNGGDDGH